MDNKEKKLLMTRVAKGEISQKEAERLIKPKKVENSKAKTPKKQLNHTGGKQNSK